MGVIVVRAWIESGAATPVRARITASSDLSTDEQTIAVEEGIEKIVEAVRAWLDAFAAD